MILLLTVKSGVIYDLFIYDLFIYDFIGTLPAFQIVNGKYFNGKLFREVYNVRQLDRLVFPVANTI
jgi:hypothetical protein